MVTARCLRDLPSLQLGALLGCGLVTLRRQRTAQVDHGLHAFPAERTCWLWPHPEWQRSDQTPDDPHRSGGIAWPHPGNRRNEKCREEVGTLFHPKV
jgi:hypothetical protein